MKPQKRKEKVKGFMVIGQRNRWIAFVGEGHKLTDHTLTDQEAKKLKTKLIPCEIIFKV